MKLIIKIEDKAGECGKLTKEMKEAIDQMKLKLM
jgi:hypothetical protein